GPGHLHRFPALRHNLSGRLWDYDAAPFCIKPPAAPRKQEKETRNHYAVYHPPLLFILSLYRQRLSGHLLRRLANSDRQRFTEKIPPYARASGQPSAERNGLEAPVLPPV